MCGVYTHIHTHIDTHRQTHIDKQCCSGKCTAMHNLSLFLFLFFNFFFKKGRMQIIDGLLLTINHQPIKLQYIIYTYKSTPQNQSNK